MFTKLVGCMIENGWLPPGTLKVTVESVPAEAGILGELPVTLLFPVVIVPVHVAGRLFPTKVYVSNPVFSPKLLADVIAVAAPAPAKARPKDNGNVNLFPAKKSVTALSMVVPGAVLPPDTGA
jgi:hypothetical protein